ncbi:unnamed protein product [Dibothriocephalus latus]|uniref:Uncharacterized protein n=1 Tax=Dibothriocephalus latus TaxID=60516 RepID=A0A3P7LI68_DIBLA|nr:unnamed protein product [Dibothriocephalus latus]
MWYVCSGAAAHRLQTRDGADVVSRRGQPWPPSPSTQRVGRGLNARRDLNPVVDLQPDVIFITETGLHTDVMDAEIVPGAYQIFRRDGLCKGGGGIIVFVRMGLVASESKISYSYDC